MEFRQALGRRLKQARRRAGMTSEQAAEAIGVVRQAVVSWESGKTFPTTDHLRDISSVYGVSLDWLLKGEDYQARPEVPAPVEIREVHLSYGPSDRSAELTKALMSASRELGPEDIKTIVDLVEFLLQRRKKPAGIR